VSASLLLGVSSMLRYPGGTTLGHAGVRYSLSQNFLSDLGMTVAYNGQPNRLGAALFVASLLLLVAGLGSCLATIIRGYAAASASRVWVQLTGFCGLLACVAFAGVAVTPENRVMPAHIEFTMWAWRIVAVVAWLMAGAAVRSAVAPRTVQSIWVVVAALLTGYVALLAWGPNVGSQGGLAVQVIAQKAATLVVIVAVLYIARETDRAKVVRLDT
jgi:hypothetical membrane protein